MLTKIGSVIVTVAVMFFSPSHPTDAASSATQAAAIAEPAFGVATIKATTSAIGPRFVRPMSGGTFSAINMPLSDLVDYAYGFLGAGFHVVGTPAWARSARFDVTAKMPADRVAPDGTFAIEDLRAMVRTLLRDRFLFEAHREARDLPIYALVKSRPEGRLGSMLRQSGSMCPPIAIPAWLPPPPPPPPGPGAPLDPNCAGFSVPGFMAVRRSTMGRFADMLSIFVNRVVEDRTGLEGLFDFDLSYLPDPAVAAQRVRSQTGSGPPPAINPDAAELFTALQEQLGLKLEPARGSVVVVVIDRLARPTLSPEP